MYFGLVLVCPVFLINAPPPLSLPSFLPSFLSPSLPPPSLLLLLIVVWFRIGGDGDYHLLLG